MADKTISGNEVGTIITELGPLGQYPLLQFAKRVTPANKDPNITRFEFLTYEGESAVADPETGGVHYRGKSSQQTISYQLWRASHPWLNTSMEGTDAERFYKQNGADITMDRLMHQIENSGIITVQAAKTAGLIANETAHIVGGNNTTFDAMTDAQLLAYLNHVMTEIASTSTATNFKLVCPKGKATRLRNLYTSIVFTVGAGSVKIDTSKQILPAVMKLLQPENIVEDWAMTYAAILGTTTSRTSTSTWGKDAFIFSVDDEPTMEYREWNQKQGVSQVEGTLTEHMIYEIDAVLFPAKYKSSYYITAAWA